MRDIVTSHLRSGLVLACGGAVATVLTGFFAETFPSTSWKCSPVAVADKPETDPGARLVLFIVEGELALTLNGQVH